MILQQRETMNKRIMFFVMLLCLFNKSLVAMRQFNSFDDVTEEQLRNAQEKLLCLNLDLAECLENKIEKPGKIALIKRLLLWLPNFHYRVIKRGHVRDDGIVKDSLSGKIVYYGVSGFLALCVGALTNLAFDGGLLATSIGAAIAGFIWPIQILPDDLEFVLESHQKAREEHERWLDFYKVLEDKVHETESRVDEMTLALACQRVYPCFKKNLLSSAYKTQFTDVGFEFFD